MSDWGWKKGLCMLEDKGTPDTSISQNGGRSCAFSPSPRDGCLLKKGSGIFQPSVPWKISVTGEGYGGFLSQALQRWNKYYISQPSVSKIGCSKRVKLRCESQGFPDPSNKINQCFLFLNTVWIDLLLLERHLMS